MGIEHEAQRHHLLTMIEAAQRRGRSERDIIEIVDEYFGREVSMDLMGACRRGVLRRLITRTTARRAA